MWGVPIRPYVTQDYGAFMRRASGIMPAYWKMDKRVSQKNPPSALTEGRMLVDYAILGKAEKTTKGNRGVVYVYPRPDLIAQQQKLPREEALKKKESKRTVAHELGHVVAFSYGPSPRYATFFLSVMSEVEYLLRHDKRAYKEYLASRRESGHPVIDQLVRRVFYTFPHSKERNAFVRLLIATKYNSYEEISDFFNKYRPPRTF
jgi:hypothetical protein